MNERIKKLRKVLDLTQQEFGDRIGIKRNTLANYEIGRNEPIDAVISLICREFNVSETWLRTGEGDMFMPSPSGALEALAREYQLDELDRDIVSEFVKLDAKAREAIKLYIKNVSRRLYLDPAPDTAGQERTAADTDGQERTEVDTAARLAELERQNRELAAKVAAMEEEDALLGLTDAFSASPSASAGSVSPVERVKK